MARQPITNAEYIDRHLLFLNLWRRDPDIFLTLTASQYCSALIYYSPCESYRETQLLHLRDIVEESSPGVVRQANGAYAHVSWIIHESGRQYGKEALNDGSAIREWVAAHPRYSSPTRSIAFLMPLLEQAAQAFVEEAIYG